MIKARVGSWFWWSSWYSMLLIPHFRWKLPYFIACEWKLKCPSFAHFLSRICALLVQSDALPILFRAHPVCSGALPVRSVLAHFRSGQMHFRFSLAHFWDGLVRHTSCPIQCTSGLVLYTSSPIWIRCGCGEGGWCQELGGRVEGAVCFLATTKYQESNCLAWKKSKANVM